GDHLRGGDAARDGNPRVEGRKCQEKTVPSSSPGYFPSYFLERLGNGRSRRRRDKARRRSNWFFGLLGFLVFAIASLHALGHSSSPHSIDLKPSREVFTDSCCGPALIGP